MLTFETAPIRIRRPAAEVFAYLADVNRHSEWSSAVVESRLEGFGPIGKGARFHQRIKMLGRTVDGLYEISDFQPARRVEFRTLSGPMPVTWDVELEADGSTTVLRSHGAAEAEGLFKLASPVMRGAMKRQAGHDFRMAKAILEEEGSDS
jgi:hypothetical protein